MQSVACLEWERSRRKLASLIALVAWCGVAVTIVSPACVAQDAFTFPLPLVHRFDNATPVYVVDKTACEAKAEPKRWGWSKGEVWAWSQICSHLPVDFDEKKANECADQQAKGTPKRDETYNKILGALRDRSPEQLATDQSRRLSGDFLSKVFGEVALRSHTWTEPLRFAGFSTDRLVIDNASLKSIELRHAHIGSFLIQNAAVDGGLRLENVHSGSVKINLVTAKNILLSNVSVSQNNSELVPPDDKRDCPMAEPSTVGVSKASARRPNRTRVTEPKQPPSKKEGQDGELLIDTVRIDDRLAIFEGDYGAMNFKHVKVDDLFIYQPEWTGAENGEAPDLSIIESVDKGVFTFQVNPESLPNRIKLKNFIFANAHLGADPMPVINAMDLDAKRSAEAKRSADEKSSADAKSSAESRPDLEPYSLIAKSYAERRGKRTSDKVLFAMNERNRDMAWTQSSTDFAWLTFLRYLVRYGFEPEWGFVYILCFVLLGWAIVWRNSDQLEPGEYQPKTWFPTLLLAFDSVIPGIQLEEITSTCATRGGDSRCFICSVRLAPSLSPLPIAFCRRNCSADRRRCEARQFSGIT
jgi:hypothetical protein